MKYKIEYKIGKRRENILTKEFDNQEQAMEFFTKLTKAEFLYKYLVCVCSEEELEKENKFYIYLFEQDGEKFKKITYRSKPMDFIKRNLKERENTMYPTLILIRKSNGYTLQKLGEKIGLSFPCISMIEKGKRNLDYFTALKIAKLFNMTTDELFERDLERWEETHNDSKAN